MRGEVVGVNTAIFSPSGGNIGIGFAVPSHLAMSVVEDLRDYGKVERGWLGVSLQPVDRELAEALGAPDAKGALIAALEPGSPAARGGLRAGDLVTKAGQRQVETPRDLAVAVAEARPGATLTLTLRRGGEQLEQQVTLSTSPDRRGAAASRRDVEGALGLELRPRQSGQGAVVARVTPGSVAEERGLQPGDLILRAGDLEVSDPGDVVSAVEAARRAGRPAIALQIHRGDARTFVALPLRPQQG